MPPTVVGRDFAIKENQLICYGWLMLHAARDRRAMSLEFNQASNGVQPESLAPRFMALLKNQANYLLPSFKRALLASPHSYSYRASVPAVVVEQALLISSVWSNYLIPPEWRFG